MDNYNLQQTDAKIQAILNKVQPVVDNNTVAGFGNGYAISTTAGATADKEVTINGFTPTIGGVFSVMFQNAFSASDPTLNVSNTGAKDLMLFGSALPAAFVTAGTILTLTYDGTNYNVIGRLNDITVKSTLESTDSPLLQDANGNFIKSTPAALASLLGVMFYGAVDDTTATNLLTFQSGVTPGRIKCFYNQFMQYIVLEGNSSCIQFRIPYYAAGGYAMKRYYVAGDSSFTEWSVL